MNLSNADYILNTNWNGITGQNITFDKAGISFGTDANGNKITSIENDISVMYGSTLNLLDNSTDTYTFGDITAGGSGAYNKINLDIDLSDGSSDVIKAGSDSKGFLQVDSDGLKILKGSGFAKTEKVFNVISGGSLAFYEEELSDYFDSGVYIYDVNAKGGNLSLIASAISENGLKYQNHFVSGDREFKFVGDNPYTIAEDLQNTLTGNFTVSGKDITAANSVISGDDLHSFFEINDSGTNLTLENLTIEHANATDKGDTEGVRTSSDNINGAVVNASTGKVTMNNVVLANNHADGNRFTPPEMLLYL